MSKNVSKAASSSMPLNESKGRWKKRRDFKKKNISSSHNKNHPFRIPEGWLDVAPFGKRVMNSPFLPFKVPLDSKYNVDKEYVYYYNLIFYIDFSHLLLHKMRNGCLK